MQIRMESGAPYLRGRMVSIRGPHRWGVRRSRRLGSRSTPLHRPRGKCGGSASLDTSFVKGVCKPEGALFENRACLRRIKQMLLGLGRINQRLLGFSIVWKGDCGCLALAKQRFRSRLYAKRTEGPCTERFFQGCEGRILDGIQSLTLFACSIQGSACRSTASRSAVPVAASLQQRRVIFTRGRAEVRGTPRSSSAKVSDRLLQTLFATLSKTYTHRRVEKEVPRVLHIYAFRVPFVIASCSIRAKVRK